ncbi:MAG: acyl-CoA desaturase [Bacteroidota bacterium]
MQSSVTPGFQQPNQSQSFYKVLSARVNDYFKKNKVQKTGNWALYSKAILLWSLYAATYVHLIFFTPHVVFAILESVLLGVVTAAIGFNVMHDGGHGSFSNSKFWNNVAAYSVNLLGGSMLMWSNKHNVVHHTFTNITGVDDDINIQPLARMGETQKRYFFHRFQHIYIWFLYGLLLFSWVLYTDYIKYFTNKVGPVKLKKLSALNHFGFWTMKVVYVFLMVVLPIYMVGAIPWLVGFSIVLFVSGLILSVVFQLAHVVEHTNFPVATQPSNNIENEWAIHQLETTANFATKNKVISWFVGGLNFQVEHHLFPQISHVHYPEISKIIKSTCKEFNVRYNEYSRMTSALASHFRHLRKMGMAN